MPTTTRTANELLNCLPPLTETEFATLALACADQAGLSSYQQRKLRDELERTVDEQLVW
jgi:hypothetical protein